MPRLQGQDQPLITVCKSRLISSPAYPKWVGRYLKKAKDYTSPFLERQVAWSDQWYATSSSLYADMSCGLLPAVIGSNGGQEPATHVGERAGALHPLGLVFAKGQARSLYPLSKKLVLPNSLSFDQPISEVLLGHVLGKLRISPVEFLKQTFVSRQCAYSIPTENKPFVPPIQIVFSISIAIADIDMVSLISIVKSYLSPPSTTTKVASLSV